MAAGGQPLLCHFVDEVRAVPRGRSLDFGRFLRSTLGTVPRLGRRRGHLVLILTRALDVEADLVGVGLASRGVEYVRVNAEDIPRNVVVRFRIAPKSGEDVSMMVRDQTFKPADVGTVWWRHFDQDLSHHAGKPFAAAFARQEWHGAVNSFLSRLNCLWISDRGAVMGADRLMQLAAARRAGLDIPRTLVTNDVSEARHFLRSGPGKVIAKAVQHHSVELNGKRFSMFSRTIDKGSSAKMRDVANSPTVFQERLEKKSEFRVTVIGKRLFACEIDSQASPAGRDDLHRIPLRDLPKRAAQIPPDTARRCVELVRALGLRFGAIDFVRDREDRLVFLEVNPTGDWYWIEHDTGLPITSAVTDFIAAASVNG